MKLRKSILSIALTAIMFVASPIVVEYQAFACLGEGSGDGVATTY
jgi:hypothetical protein